MNQALLYVDPGSGSVGRGGNGSQPFSSGTLPFGIYNANYRGVIMFHIGLTSPLHIGVYRSYIYGLIIDIYIYSYSRVYKCCM